jgi:hypothetical protein
MKTFKQHLAEGRTNPNMYIKNISWQKDLVDHILNDTWNMLYLPPRFMADNFAKVSNVIVYHGASMYHFRGLALHQNSRSAISSFNRLEEYGVIRLLRSTFSGDYRDEDGNKDVYQQYAALFQLKANVVMSNGSDIMSIPDEKGIRGVSLHSLFQITDSDSYEFLGKKNDLRDYIKELESKYGKPLYMLENDSDKNIKRDVAATKAKILKEYYKLTTKFLLDNKEVIEEHYRKPTHDQHGSYNELVVNRYKIEKILIIHPQMKDEIIEELKKLKLDNKIVNPDVKETSDMITAVKKFIGMP